MKEDFQRSQEDLNRVKRLREHYRKNFKQGASDDAFLDWVQETLDIINGLGWKLPSKGEKMSSDKKSIKVAVLEPGMTQFEWREIVSGYKTLQTLVGGLIERVPVPETEDEASIYVNEEGKLENLPVSAIWWYQGKPYDLLRGTLVVCGSSDDGRDTDLTPAMLDRVKTFITPFSQK